MERPADLMVTLRCPPSVNELWCIRHFNGRANIVRTPQYERWIKAEAMAAKFCRQGQPITGPYALRITVPANRGDLGNYEKAVSDALQKGEAIQNDRHAERIEMVRDRAREKDSVLVELWAC